MKKIILSLWSSICNESKHTYSKKQSPNLPNSGSFIAKRKRFVVKNNNFERSASLNLTICIDIIITQRHAHDTCSVICRIRTGERESEITIRMFLRKTYDIVSTILTFWRCMSHHISRRTKITDSLVVICQQLEYHIGLCKKKEAFLYQIFFPFAVSLYLSMCIVLCVSCFNLISVF